MSAEQLVASGNLSLTRGLYDEALQHFLEARAIAFSFAQADPLWAEIHRGLAQACLHTGKLDDCEQAILVSLKTDEAYWGPDSPQLTPNLVLLGDVLRSKGDFERAKPAFERALGLLQRELGMTNEQTLEVYGRLVILYLEAGIEYGLEDLHKTALACYQACFPTGSWATFLHLEELVNACAADGRATQAESLLKREVAVLTKLLGRTHKETAAVQRIQAEMLKGQHRMMASWQVSTQTAKAAAAAESNEQLFLSEQRDYAVPLEDCRSVIERMLSIAGSVNNNAPAILNRIWWQVDSKRSGPTELLALLRYADGDGGQNEPGRGGARLKLSVRFTNRASKTRVDYDCTLASSSRLSLARDLVRFTICEIDQTLAIVPTSMPAQPGELRAVSIPTDGFWPTPQQYNEAIQNPKLCCGPLELREALPEVNQLGLPRPCSGAMATVYRLGSSSGDWAVKCFTPRVTDQQARYRAISARLDEAHLRYFVPFQYIAEGIKIGGQWFPLVQMRWVQAKALNVYVVDHLADADRLHQLGDKVVSMIDEMQEAGIAHGDLQHGNILVSNDELLLVDYDGMWVPELARFPASEIGHPNFQHPARSREHFGPYLDNFPGWLIYCSLNFLARDPLLWERLEGGDDCLLLRHEDLLDPNSSKRLNVLLNHSDEEIRNLARVIIRLLALPPEKVPTFATVFSA